MTFSSPNSSVLRSLCDLFIVLNWQMMSKIRQLATDENHQLDITETIDFPIEETISELSERVELPDLPEVRKNDDSLRPEPPDVLKIEENTIVGRPVPVLIAHAISKSDVWAKTILKLAGLLIVFYSGAPEELLELLKIVIPLLNGG